MSTENAAPRLHELSSGSVIADGNLVAVRRGGWWYLADRSPGPYTVGDLLAMSQNWIILREETS